MGSVAKYVLFRLNGQCYGVPIGLIREVTYITPVTRLPHTPVYVEGVVDLRGEIIPVVDLRKRLGMAEAARNKQSRLMVLSLGERSAALVVDGVEQVVSLDDEMVVPPDEQLRTIGSEFVLGMARSDGELLVMLDLDRLMEPAAVLLGAIVTEQNSISL